MYWLVWTSGLKSCGETLGHMGVLCPTATPPLGGGLWKTFPQDTPDPECYFLSEQEVSVVLLMVTG